MLADGIYRIAYQSRADGGDDGDFALAVLRGGQITGSDKHGGVFHGTYECSAATSRDVVKLRLEVPPGGMLVTGLDGGPAGTAIEISATFEPLGHMSKAQITIAWQPVEIELTFIGPLPN